MSVALDIVRSRLRRLSIALALATVLAWLGTFILLKVDASPLAACVPAALLGVAVLLQTLAPRRERSGTSAGQAASVVTDVPGDALTRPSEEADGGRDLVVVWTRSPYHRSAARLAGLDAFIERCMGDQEDGRLDSFVVRLSRGGGHLWVQGPTEQVTALREEFVSLIHSEGTPFDLDVRTLPQGPAVADPPGPARFAEAVEGAGTEPIGRLAEWLDTTLGTGVTAFTAGLTPHEYVRIVHGDATPGPEEEQRLRNLYAVASTLLPAHGGAAAAHAWLTEPNENLGGQIPATLLALGEDPRRVISAIREQPSVPQTEGGG